MKKLAPYRFRPVPSVTPADVPVWRKLPWEKDAWGWLSSEQSHAKSSLIMRRWDARHPSMSAYRARNQAELEGRPGGEIKISPTFAFDKPARKRKQKVEISLEELGLA